MTLSFFVEQKETLSNISKIKIKHDTMWAEGYRYETSIY